MRPDGGALLILCCFILLSLTYSIASPVFEASDELNHYPVVEHLARGRGLPIQEPGQETLWGQEGSQPPLYYLLAAGLTFWIDSDDLPDLLYLNPHAERGVPLAQGNKNMIVHTDKEGFSLPLVGTYQPWRGTVLAVHLIRLFSVLLGAGTVLCTYLLAGRLFPGQPAIALGAMALNAFLPMFIFISASLNNDNLAVLLSSVVLLMLVRLVQEGTTRRYLLALGAIIGLAGLSKLSALGLVPLAGLALALRPLRARQNGPDSSSISRWPNIRRWAIDFFLLLLPAILVAGWWFVRNWQFYGDPSGLNVMLDIAGRRPETFALPDLLTEFQGFRINFWGLFGGVNVLMQPGWIYRLLDILSVIAIAGLAIWAWHDWRQQDFAGWPALMVPAAWIAIESVALIRWTSATLASQGRLIFPAISAICLFLVLGWIGWLPRRLQGAVVILLSAFMLALAASAPFTAILPAYARPADLIAEAVPPTARPFDVDYGGKVRLLAFETDKVRIRPGDTLDVTLYWQALAPMEQDFSVYVQVFGWQQELDQADSYPGGGTYPTNLWQLGEIVRDRYRLRIPEDAQGPAPAWITAGLYEFATMERPAATDSAGQPVIFPILTRLDLVVPESTWRPDHPLDANLNDQVRLIGYDAAAEPVRPGSEWALTLYWQVAGELAEDYTVFVHLTDETGAIISQTDAPPLQGFYPASAWQAGEILNDTHTLRLAEDMPAGEYQVWAGLYDATNGERLPLLDGSGQPIDNQILITTLQVRPQ